MKTRLLGAACACSLILPVAANAAFYDFQAWTGANGEQGFTNASPFSMTDSGLTLTAMAFELPGMVASHVYMDGSYNGIIGGMGVCTNLDGSNQCTPSSDDNVSIDGTNQEILSWNFSSSINSVTLEMGDNDHYTYANKDFQYQVGGGGWLTGTTDASGLVTLNLGSAASGIDFKTIGAGLSNQFYIRNASATVVPVPAAVWLFGSGLIGLVGIARRKST